LQAVFHVHTIAASKRERQRKRFFCLTHRCGPINLGL
jgi:hypothetical protein